MKIKKIEIRKLLDGENWCGEERVDLAIAINSLITHQQELEKEVEKLKKTMCTCPHDGVAASCPIHGINGVKTRFVPQPSQFCECAEPAGHKGIGCWNCGKLILPPKEELREELIDILVSYARWYDDTTAPGGLSGDMAIDKILSLLVQKKG